MPPKRKTRNLPRTNDKEKNNQMSFFDPVYQNDNVQLNEEESGSELSPAGASKQKTQTKTKSEPKETSDSEPPSEITTNNIVARIQQIEKSIEQAQTMLQSMDKFKHLVPGSQEQCEKLHVIIESLEEQRAGYVNLLNLITLTSKEKAELLERIAATRQNMTNDPNNEMNYDNDDVDEEIGDNDEDEDDDQSSRRNVRSPVRPRIESKIGFTPQPIIPPTPTVPTTINSSDNEQTTRNDNSNYDSLIGSLKSDTLNWKDQQYTSGDDASDAESEKEIEKNLMLQKEQLRALQGQKRALLALKKRSEQRLVEQQQLTSKKSNEKPENLSEKDLISDINNLRDRLKLLRNLYDQKHQVELQDMKSSSKKAAASTDSRTKRLEYVREQLNELEHIVKSYQSALVSEPEEVTTVYEETPIQPDDAQRLRALLMKERQKPTLTIQNNENSSKPVDKLSSELAAKRQELEEAKSALNRLQQMVKKIEPDEGSSSARSTPKQSSFTKPTATTTMNTNNYELTTNQHQYAPKTNQSTNTNTKNSLLSNILSPKVSEQQKPIPARNSYADAKMAAQHREIERLIESRQRLHTIKDQIASLHQSMATPPIQSKQETTNQIQLQQPYKNDFKESKHQNRSYEDKLNSPKNIRTSYLSNEPEGEEGEEEENNDEDSELYRFEYESGDGEEINDESVLDEEIQPRMKQENFHMPEDIVAEHEQRLLNKRSNSVEELSSQMREICRCLSTFIQEQKSFNQHIEEHLKAITNTATQTPIAPNLNDPVFNQLQQQVLTQGLIVNLNTAYREIAVLQSEINALQIENNRLTSSISSRDDQYRSNVYSRDDSKNSIYSLDQIKPIRPHIRSRYDERFQQDKHLSSANNKFENSSKTSFTSQSTGQQTAIHLTENNMERTPVKQDRNAYNSKRLSSPKPIHSRAKPISDEYEITNNNHRNSAKENLSKSFVIRRRPLSNEAENSHIKSQLFNYDQRLQQDQFNDDDDDSENEQQADDDQSATLFNIQPSNFYRTTTHSFDNMDMEKIHDQIKSAMSQLIPFIKSHVHDSFNQSILTEIRNRVIYALKQESDSSEVIRHFQSQFSELIDKNIEKYCGTIVRECATDLMRDISDIVFDELIKCKIYQNNNNIQTTDTNEQNLESSIKQEVEYSNLYDPSVPEYIQQTSSITDDGDNDNKYIELAESENRPMTLICSDEEDNDPDLEENKDSELETAVSRQEINLNQNEIASAGEIHSNGHEYVLVHHGNHVLNPVVDNPLTNNDDDEKINENEEGAES